MYIINTSVHIEKKRNYWGAFLLINLNLDSSIENWTRLLTSWNLKADLFSHGIPWVEVTLRLLISGSCNQTIKTAIDKSIDQNGKKKSKTSLKYQSERSASGGGSFGLQSKIGLR